MSNNDLEFDGYKDSDFEGRIRWYKERPFELSIILDEYNIYQELDGVKHMRTRYYEDMSRLRELKINQILE